MIDETLEAVHDLDNKAFFASDCTILFFFGFNDDGERYVDAEMVKGHVHIQDRQDHDSMADILNAEDLLEALRMLVKEL